MDTFIQNIGYYSRHEKERRNSIAFIVDKDAARIGLGYSAINDQIISTGIYVQLFNMMIILVCFPTTNVEKKMMSFMIKFKLKLTEHAIKIWHN